MSKLCPSFAAMIYWSDAVMRDLSHFVHTETWQGVSIEKMPEARMREVLHHDFRVPMTICNMDTPLESLRDELKPNLPWADEHFEERICGYPMNPGKSWEHWPWANSSKDFLDSKGRFEINYMERFWAGKAFAPPHSDERTVFLTGIRDKPYGDLSDIIDLLIREPLTRQAWLPIFFPEDTGAGGRVPCSLGYHWLMRGGYLNVFYPIRSCDYYRHFRDDVYLAVRLTMWLRDTLARRAPERWNKVQLGYFSMWVGSLHVFVNDYARLFASDGTPRIQSEVVR
jgi:hypothetical protein